MRHILTAVTVALVTCVLVVPFARGTEQVPSTQYQSWAKYKPGTAVTMKQQMKMQGMTMDVEMHQELTEVTPDKAVVQMWTVSKMMGQSNTSPKQTLTLPAKVDKGAEDMPPGFEGKIEVIGDEKVTVGGKEYDCKVVRFTGKQQGMQSTGKIWGTDAVPGRTVKIEMKVTGETAMDMTGELAKVEIKE